MQGRRQRALPCSQEVVQRSLGHPRPLDDTVDADRLDTHPTDRRVKLVRATAAGTALAQRAEPILETPPVGLFELPADDLEALGRIMTRIRRNQEPGESLSDK